jgi:hypothetical protein
MNPIYNELERMSFGDLGHEYLTTSTPTTAGVFYSAIQVVDDSTITYKVYTTSGTVTHTSIAVTAGDIVYGILSEIAVVSGRVRAYKRQ